jgi:hypothetical protein
LASQRAPLPNRVRIDFTARRPLYASPPAASFGAWGSGGYPPGVTRGATGAPGATRGA